MYARIENGEVVEYPLFEGDLQKRLPQYKFPLDTNVEENGFEVPEGYVKVQHTYIANPDPFSYYTEGLPKIVDGVWTKNIIRTPMTMDEKLAKKGEFETIFKHKRDDLLKESDLLVMNDRWMTWTQEQKDAITHYRQALRDLTKQPGFPLTTQWPDKPNLEEQV